MLFFQYFLWHYTTAVKHLLEIARNYLVATWFRFGILFHLRTLFYPWRRQLVDDTPDEGIIMFLLSKIGTIVTDLIFRFIAALLRLSVIISGLITLITLICLFAVLLVAWLLWPIIFILSISKGFQSLNT